MKSVMYASRWRTIDAAPYVYERGGGNLGDTTHAHTREAQSNTILFPTEKTQRAKTPLMYS